MQLDYGHALETDLAELETLLAPHHLTTRGRALRLLEEDAVMQETLLPGQQAAAANVVARAHQGQDIDLQLADIRYGHIHQWVQQARQQKGKLTEAQSEWLDRVLLNRWIGIPFFLFVMYLMFLFAINVGSAFIDFFDIMGGALFVDGVHHLLGLVNAPEWLGAILADGFGVGLQTVATFIPVIGCLYLFLAVLESSGYLARAAFVVDALMRRLGLPGKAFVPMLMGFGCTVPSVMATRTLNSERERLMTSAMAPFMSCGARLPVYALFAVAFFPESGQNLVFGLYLIGIVVAVLTGLLLRSTLLPGKSDSMLMEMPDYEWPRPVNVAIKTWQKLKSFVFGAGKTIVLVVAVLSVLNSLGTDGSFGHQEQESSVLSKISQAVTPVLHPIGVRDDNWQATVGIVTGIFAKEAVVGTLNSLYAGGGDAEEESEFSLVASFHEAIDAVAANLAEINPSDPWGLMLATSTTRKLPPRRRRSMSPPTATCRLTSTGRPVPLPTSCSCCSTCLAPPPWARWCGKPVVSGRSLPPLGATIWPLCARPSSIRSRPSPLIRSRACSGSSATAFLWCCSGGQVAVTVTSLPARW